MTRSRRILWWVASLWATVAVCLLYSYRLARGTPEWYGPPVGTPEQRQMAANESDQKFASALSFAADVAAAQRRRYRHGPGNPADTMAPLTLSFDELGLSAFVDKWEALAGVRGNALSHFLSDPRLALRDNRLVIAARLNDLGILNGSVVSIQFRPTLDDQGRFWPGLSRVYDGRLPIPWVILNSPRARFRDSLARQLADAQAQAEITADGIANRNAAKCAWEKLALAALDSSCAEALILLPFDPTNSRDFVPLRLSRLDLSGGWVALTLSPLKDEELSTVLPAMKAP
jgi:hypothetical protein